MARLRARMAKLLVPEFNQQLPLREQTIAEVERFPVDREHRKMAPGRGWLRPDGSGFLT
jgi:hypothetical protein